MAIEYDDPNDVLQNVQKFLHDPFWPEHLSVGDEICLPTRDHYEHSESGDITIAVVDTETIRLETWRKLPDLALGKRTDQKMSREVSKSANPVVFQAILLLALAFRLDCHTYDWNVEKVQKSLSRTRSRKLSRAYKLLERMPWLPTLDTASYQIQGNPTGDFCSLGVIFTQMNDFYLCIGCTSERVYQESGGGRYLNTLHSLMVLGEAIRLENEGK